MEMAESLFVYGTLLPQNVPPCLRGLVNRLRWCGEACVRGVLFDLGESPGAILDESTEARVFGGVVQLPEEGNVLAELDSYEGIDAASPDSGLFVRRRHQVLMDDGRTLECWVYEYNGDRSAPVIASGRYVKAGDKNW